MAAPNLTRQPAEIFDLIARHADFEDLNALRATSTTLAADASAYRSRLQRLEWGLALQDVTGSISNDYIANERKLTALGVHTFNLTLEEERALRRAVNSLSSRPPPLSNERREELLQRCTPLYCQLTGRAPITSWPSSIPISLVVDIYLDYLGVFLPNGVDPIRYLSSSIHLTQLALVEASFSDVLLAFSEDSERGKSYEGTSSLQTVISRLRKWSILQVSSGGDATQIPLGWKEVDSTHQVLAALLLRSEFQFRPKNLPSSYYLFEYPLLIQQLSFTGFDFQQTTPGENTSLFEMGMTDLHFASVAGIVCMLNSHTNEELLEILNRQEGRSGLRGWLAGLEHSLWITVTKCVQKDASGRSQYGAELRRQLASPDQIKLLRAEHTREDPFLVLAGSLGSRFSEAELAQLDENLAATLIFAARMITST